MKENHHHSRKKKNLEKPLKYKYTKKHLSKKFKEIYQIKTPLDLDKSQFHNYFKQIASADNYNHIIGYITIDKIFYFNNNQTFLIYRNGLFLGMIYFQNLTYEFKKSILGSKYINDSSLKSKSNINIYNMGWTLLAYDMNKILIDIVINKFRKIIKWMSK